MAFVIADRVQETTIVVGTGTATLLGAATGYQSFSAGIGASNTTYYVIADQSGSNWEVGFGTLDATGLILTRTTILSSSNSNSVVSFPAGTKNVWCDYPAKKAALQDSLGLVTVPVLQTSSTSSVTPVLTFNGATTNYAAGAAVSGSYLQTILQNSSATAGASTNYVLSNNLGTDSTYYGEFGMNSSVFSASTPSDFFSINNGVYFSGHDGDITVGSGNGFKYYMAWGTAGQSAHVINATGAIGLSTNLGTTPALSGTTGFGTSGQVLTSAGSSASPTWTTPTTGTVTSVSGTTGRITSTGGTTPVIDLASGIATAGTTGSSTLIPVVTVDTFGRVTSITTASNPQGTVTSVTGTAPVVSSGGATPAISMAAATTSVNGYLTSTDWNTFNGKQAALVSGTNIKTVNSTSLLGSGDVSVGVTSVTGTAPVVSSGGATPAISMAAATTSVSGYLTSTDWNTFNSKLSTAVTSAVAGTGVSVSGSTGAVTFSIGQAVATTSNVQFNSLGVGTAGSGTGGEIRATNNVTAFYSSDRKWKENIQIIDKATDKVVSIGGKYFDWTEEYIASKGGEDGYFVNKQDFGVIAQDVKAVFPQAVRTREDGSLAVDYAKLSALAFASIAELHERIKVLEELKYPRTGA